MRRAGWLLLPAVVVRLIVGLAIGAIVRDGYDGRDHRDRVVQITSPGGEQGGEPVQTIRIDDDGPHWRGLGFGFVLFPLLLIGLVWLVVAAFWHRGPGGRGWDRFEDWHRHQHGNGGPGTGESGTASA